MEEKGKQPAGATGGCLDPGASSVLQINPGPDPASPTPPPMTEEHGHTGNQPLSFWA